jgi:hypothetical protein
VVGKRKEEDGHLQVWERAIKEGLMGKNGKGKEAVSALCLVNGLKGDNKELTIVLVVWLGVACHRTDEGEREHSPSRLPARSSGPARGWRWPSQGDRSRGPSSSFSFFTPRRSTH